MVIGDIKMLARNLKHLHSVETRFYCLQTFLSPDFQCRGDVSEFKQTFRDVTELHAPSPTGLLL
jgi:hypothetical protein